MEHATKGLVKYWLGLILPVILLGVASSNYAHAFLPFWLGLVLTVVWCTVWPSLSMWLGIALINQGDFPFPLECRECNEKYTANYITKRNLKKIADDKWSPCCPKCGWVDDGMVIGKMVIEFDPNEEEQQGRENYRR